MLPFLCFTAQFLMGRNPGNEKKLNVAHFPAGTEVIGVYFPKCLSFIVEISISIQYPVYARTRERIYLDICVFSRRQPHGYFRSSAEKEISLMHEWAPSSKLAGLFEFTHAPPPPTLLPFGEIIKYAPLWIKVPSTLPFLTERTVYRRYILNNYSIKYRVSSLEQWPMHLRTSHCWMLKTRLLRN